MQETNQSLKVYGYDTDSPTLFQCYLHLQYTTVHYAEVDEISKGNLWQKSVYSKGG